MSKNATRSNRWLGEHIKCWWQQNGGQRPVLRTMHSHAILSQHLCSPKGTYNFHFSWNCPPGPNNIKERKDGRVEHNSKENENACICQSEATVSPYFFFLLWDVASDWHACISTLESGYDRPFPISFAWPSSVPCSFVLCWPGIWKENGAISRFLFSFIFLLLSVQTNIKE